MDNTKYVDIFSTKGIEYLVVIFFLGVLILFWRYLWKMNESEKRPEVIKQMGGDWFKTMYDYFYHLGHAWAKPQRDNLFLVGMDDFAQALVGKPDALVLPQTGDILIQGESGWTLKKDAREIKMLSPVSGQVVEVNQRVIKHPEIINENPYEEGWLLKIRTDRGKTNLRNLLPGKLAAGWMEGIQENLSRKLSGHAGYVLQDGGKITPGFSQELDASNWDQIAARLFLTDNLD